MPARGLSIRTAAALVCFTLGAYLGLDRKVRWRGPACSIPITPSMSISGSPASSQPRRVAMASSFTATGYLSTRKPCGCGRLDSDEATATRHLDEGHVPERAVSAKPGPLHREHAPVSPQRAQLRAVGIPE